MRLGGTVCTCPTCHGQHGAAVALGAAIRTGDAAALQITAAELERGLSALEAGSALCEGMPPDNKLVSRIRGAPDVYKTALSMLRSNPCQFASLLVARDGIE